MWTIGFSEVPPGDVSGQPRARTSGLDCWYSTDALYSQSIVLP